MIGVYFSGTGNTKFCVDKFLKEYDHSENSFSIEDNETLRRIENHNEIVIGYPVQFSNIPKILRDYIVDNRHIWKGKKIFIIATMGLFSGDGAGILYHLAGLFGQRLYFFGKTKKYTDKLKINPQKSGVWPLQSRKPESGQSLFAARTSSSSSMPEPSGRSRSQQTTSGVALTAPLDELD